MLSEYQKIKLYESSDLIREKEYVTSVNAENNFINIKAYSQFTQSYVYTLQKLSYSYIFAIRIKFHPCRTGVNVVDTVTYILIIYETHSNVHNRATRVSIYQRPIPSASKSLRI